MPDQNTIQRVIKGHQIVSDDWTVLQLQEGQEPATAEVAAGKVIVPLKVWQSQKETLSGRAEIGVWLNADERPEDLKEDLGKFGVIAVNFPKFTDGRGYSIAYNLRKRLGYTGELRAIGDVLRDQLFQMKRTGFDAYAPRPDRSIEDALKGLTVFSETYQASVDDKLPLFRRHARTAGAREHNDIGSGI
jgi:uncharacterized protein (DUF934 family)